MDAVAVPPVSVARWLALIDREYLARFVPAGGGAVKFVIAGDDDVRRIASGCVSAARRSGLHPVAIAAGETRLHMLQDVVFAISRALPWDSLVQHSIEALFAANDYPWPAPGRALSLAELAAHFNVAPPLVARNRDQWLSRDLWDDPHLAQDFRAALMRLALARLEAEIDVTPVLQWLRGEKVPVAALRECDISARITRTNARAILLSLCHWLRKAGAAGLLLTLDLRAALRPTPQATLRYAPAAVMDLYEVLRELVDDIEHFPGLFVLVLADAALVAGDPRRTLDCYKALEMRIWPDVRPGDRQNPLAPLVTVGG